MSSVFCLSNALLLEGPKIASTRAPEAPRLPTMAPEGPKRLPRSYPPGWPSKAPKWFPRCPQEAPELSPEGPKIASRLPKMYLRWPERPLDATKRPKMAQEGPQATHPSKTTRWLGLGGRGRRWEGAAPQITKTSSRAQGPNPCLNSFSLSPNRHGRKDAASHVEVGNPASFASVPGSVARMCTQKA